MTKDEYEKMEAFIRSVMLPDVADQLQNALERMLERADIHVVLLAQIGDKGIITATCTHVESVGLMRDASEGVVLEVLTPKGPVQ